MKQRSSPRQPAWFRIPMMIFCAVIAAGILFIILFLTGALDRDREPHISSGVFRVLLQVLPEQEDSLTLSAIIEYDPAYQKLTVTPGTEDVLPPETPTADKSFFLRMSAGNFRKIVDKAGGISLTGTDGKTVLLHGEEAYAFACGGGSGDPDKDEAVLFSAFLDTLRLHAHDEVFALKLLAYAFPRVETDISLKTVSEVGKAILKADAISVFCPVI